MFGKLTFKEIIFPKERLKKIKRKQKFVDRLKGPQIYASVSSRLPAGATFSLVNEGTQQIIMCAWQGGQWFVWGDIFITGGLSIREFEDFLTEQQITTMNNNAKLRITDQYGCITWHTQQSGL